MAVDTVAEIEHPEKEQAKEKAVTATVAELERLKMEQLKEKVTKEERLAAKEEEEVCGLEMERERLVAKEDARRFVLAHEREATEEARLLVKAKEETR